MANTAICPRCENLISSFARPREQTFCELCGTSVVIPPAPVPAQRAPSLATIQKRARFAETHKAQSPRQRWTGSLALLAILTLPAYLAAFEVHEHFFDRRSFHYPVDGLVVSDLDPRAPFPSFGALWSHLSEMGADHGWTVVFTDTPPLWILTDWWGDREVQELLDSYTQR